MLEKVKIFCRIQWFVNKKTKGQLNLPGSANLGCDTRQKGTTAMIKLQRNVGS